MTFVNEEWVCRQDSSDETRRDYEKERLVLWATDLIAELMTQKGVSKADLARKLGTSRAHITQMLSGSRNVTLNTLADTAWALGRRVVIKTEPLRAGAYISCPVQLISDNVNTVVKMSPDNQGINYDPDCWDVHETLYAGAM